MKKIFYIVIPIIILTIIASFAIFFKYFFRGGKQIKNINETTTNIPTKETDSKNVKIFNSNQFNWSTMTEGPYYDKVTYATSTDLINWTASSVILAEHASVPGAVIKDGVIYAYFVDVSENGLPEQLGMVSSSDNGKTWTNRQILTIDGLQNRAPADPNPVLLDDGQIRLYYFDINEARLNKPENNIKPTNKIYSAVSSNGINFRQEEGVRFQRQEIFDPDVNLFNGLWYLYGGDAEGNKVIVATSRDGLTFEEKGVAYTGGAVPDVFKTDSQYYLFTAGIDIAISSDPFLFSRSGKFFRDFQYPITADPSVVELKDKNYLMIYKVSLGKSETSPFDLFDKEKTLQKFSLPMENANERITKKPFGIFITPQTSPIQPERFSGFHTGTDFEITKDELLENVKVRAICRGKILEKSKIAGYGGVIIQSCTISENVVTILYGHLDIASDFVPNVDDFVALDTLLAYLAPNNSEYSGGERKHLHLGIHKGENINYQGYVQNKDELSDWINIESLREIF
jgi:hypothetical protein